MIRDISDPVYGNAVYFCIGEDYSKLVKHYRKKSGDNETIFTDIEADVDGYCFNINGYNYVSIERYDELSGILVHELGHLVLSILDRAGFIPDDDTKHEPFCYLIQYYYERCVKLGKELK